MNKYLFFIGMILTLSGNVSCNAPKTTKVSVKRSPELPAEKPGSETINSIPEAKNNLTDFVPEGYIIFEKVFGELNKDSLEDCIIIIKGSDKNKIVKDEYRGELDRNRRGIIVLFKRNDGYEVAVRNKDCFSSENEDGGVYYAPELPGDKQG